MPQILKCSSLVVIFKRKQRDAITRYKTHKKEHQQLRCMVMGTMLAMVAMEAMVATVAMEDMVAMVAMVAMVDTIKDLGV